MLTTARSKLQGKGTMKVFTILTFSVIGLCGTTGSLEGAESDTHTVDGCAACATTPQIEALSKSRVIRLRNREFEPAADRVGSFALDVKDRHQLIQFTEGEMKVSVEKLKQLGVQILHWVPDYAVAAYVPEGVDASGIDGVAWVGTLGVSDKLSHQLSTTPDEQMVVVDIFPEIDRDALGAKLEALDVTLIRDISAHDDSLLINATLEQLEKIAAISEVSYIFPASKDLIDGKAIKRCPGAMTEYGPIGMYVTNGSGWDGPGQNPISLTYRFRNGTPDLANEQSIVVNALTTWSQYAQISWSSTASSGLSRSMEIAWGPHPNYPFDGLSGTLAYCFYPSPPNSEPVAGDMYFDESETWTANGGASGIDLFTVALHESGHGLGLAHSDNPGAVMYAYYRGGAVTDLHTDDINGIRALYASSGGGGGGGIVADSYEPDNSTGAAKLISNNVTQNRNLHQIGDVDFVRFVLGSSTTITLETSGSLGDTRLYLYNSSGTQIAFDDDGGAGTFSKIVRALTAGTYYAKVDEYGNNGTISNYTLRLSYASSSGDGYEPNNSSSTANSIASGIGQVHSISPVGDIDYVRFSVYQTSDVVIETSGSLSSDTEIKLFGSSLSQLEYNDDGGSGLYSRIDRLNSDSDALTPGTYYVAINEYGDNATISSYTITVTVSPVGGGGGGGGDDAYEENDTRLAAYHPGFNWEQTDLSSISGSGIQSDQDWYEIDVSPTGFERVLVDATFRHADGDIDIQLYNSSGTLLKGAYSVTDNETLSHQVPTTGSYFIRVFYGNRGNPYDLSWDDVQPAQSVRQFPRIHYTSPRSGTWLTTRRHYGRAFDNDGFVRAVHRVWPRDPWRRTYYSGARSVYSYGVHRNNSDFRHIRRWVRFISRATDNHGQRSYRNMYLRRS